MSATDSARETAFVQACLRAHFAPGDPDVRDDMSGLSASLVFDVARLNKVVNFFLGKLPPVLADGKLSTLSGLIDSYRRRTIALNSAGLMEMRAIRDALNRDAIDFVFLKGPVQQKVLYGDLFMKPSGDMDVLVSPKNFLKAREALRSIGYEVSTKSRSVWWIRFLGEQHLTKPRPRQSTVDLHHRLQQPGSPSPRDIDGFLARKQWVEVAQAKVPLISAGDMLLLSCISVAKAFYNREACAGYVCDIRASLDTMSEAEQRDAFLHAGDGYLADTLMLGIRAADVLLGPSRSILSDQARRAAPRIDDENLLGMVIAPWLPTIKWPHRRALLWELCGRKPVRYAMEACWAAAAEIALRIFERSEK